MELRDRTEVDGEGELHLLSLAETEIRGLDEYTGGTEVHSPTELTPPAGNVDVYGRAGAVPGVQSAFHGSSSLVIFLSASELTATIMPSFPQTHGAESTYRGTAYATKSCGYRPAASSDGDNVNGSFARRICRISSRTVTGQWSERRAWRASPALKVTRPKDPGTTAEPKVWLRTI